MKFLPVQLDSKKVIRGFAAMILLLGLVEPFFFPPTASAAATGYVRLTRLAASTIDAGGLVCFTPQTVGTEGKVMITFAGNGTNGATSFGVSTTTTDWSTNTTNIPAGTTAWPTISANASAVSGAAVTFTSGDLTVGTQYCFNFTTTGAVGLKTPSSAGNNLTGSITTQTSAPATIDNVNNAYSIVSNDQVVVTATVTSSFSMSLSGNTAIIGTLPTSGAPASATGITLTISTNAANGWTAWAKNTNANSTLTSATTSDTSISSGVFAAGAGNIHNLTGAAGYGLAVAAGTGSPTIATEYSTSSPSVGSLDSTQFEKIASNTVPANGNTATLTFSAEALPTTKPASDYTDTVTITAAGQF